MVYLSTRLPIYLFIYFCFSAGCPSQGCWSTPMVWTARSLLVNVGSEVLPEPCRHHSVASRAWSKPPGAWLYSSYLFYRGEMTRWNWILTSRINKQTLVTTIHTCLTCLPSLLISRFGHIFDFFDFWPLRKDYLKKKVIWRNISLFFPGSKNVSENSIFWKVHFYIKMPTEFQFSVLRQANLRPLMFCICKLHDNRDHRWLFYHIPHG